MAVWPLVEGDRCGEAFLESLTIILEGTFSTGRISRGGPCAEVTNFHCIKNFLGAGNKSYRLQTIELLLLHLHEKPGNKIKIVN